MSSVKFERITVVTHGLALIAFLSLFLTSEAVFAQPLRTVVLDSNISPTRTSTYENRDIPAFESYSAPNAAASMAGLASYTTLKTQAFGDAGNTTFVFASSLAKSRDTLRVGNSFLDGAGGYAKINLSYLWAFFDSENGLSHISDAEVLLELAGTAAYARVIKTADLTADGPIFTESVEPLTIIGAGVDNGSLINNYFSVFVPIVFGMEYNLTTYLSTQVTVNRGSAQVDAFNSVYWGGLSAYNANFEEVDFTLESGSGTDYSRSYAPITAVPEPETYALMVAGLGLVGLMARRRKAA